MIKIIRIKTGSILLDYLVNKSTLSDISSSFFVTSTMTKLHSISQNYVIAQMTTTKPLVGVLAFAVKHSRYIEKIKYES